MSFNATLTRTIDWFIPAERLNDREMRTRARMFLLEPYVRPDHRLRHSGLPAVGGPRFGADPGRARRLHRRLLDFPFLRQIHRRYEILAFISIQNLLFAILWGCYFYGGFSSPFLPWLVTVPLLAFFYLSASVAQLHCDPAANNVEPSGFHRPVLCGRTIPAQGRTCRYARHWHHFDSQRLDLRFDDGAVLRRHFGLAERVRTGGAQAHRDRGTAANRDERSGARERRQGRIPRQDEPRIEDSAQLGHRLQPDAARRHRSFGRSAAASAT